MSNIYDNDILITKSNDRIFLDLECGYGQPCTTTVHLKKTNGDTSDLFSFDGNAVKKEIGAVSGLKYNAIDIHTTIHDIRDSDTEKEDLSLKIKVYDSEMNFADTAFTQKTKGKGAIFHSFYLVTII